MNFKKILAATLACALSMSFISMTAVMAMDTGAVYDDDEDVFSDVSVTGENSKNWSIKTDDTILPAKTFYVSLGEDNALLYVGDNRAESRYVVDKDYFSFKLKKDTNSKYVKNVTVEDAKKIDDQRANFLKFVLNDYTGVDDVKTDGTITFTARKNASAEKNVGPLNTWQVKDVLTINYTLWLSNDAAENDDTIDAGDRFYFNPSKNESNVLIWGGDRDIAALRFEADNDAAKFYARLSTKVAAELWEEYGDPADAELWSYDFVNHPSIPATSRATLTLGLPWNDDEAYAPAPEDCFIYSYVDGELNDITDSFSYSDDAEEIPGWSIKTRTLGTYIISDTELDIGGYDDDIDDEPVLDDPDVDVDNVEPAKPIPNTGSSDMVNVAVVAAVVSLAAAGAVAFRKAK